MQTFPTVSAPSYDVSAWRRGYASQPQEFDYWIEDVEGHIPLALQGTLFRNGPGLLDINGDRMHHPFDGDGLINAITFSDGRAHFRSRFVRTKGYVAEQAAGKLLYRGVFGTQKPGGWLANAFDFRLKNIANTHVIYWGGKLLALWEAAEPHQLDPVTLETIGLEYFDGSLAAGSAFAAHPKIDPACTWLDNQPCLVSFAIKPGLSTAIVIYELNQAGQMIDTHTHYVPGFAFIHDFVVTPNYCIFFQNPVSFNPFPYALGLKGAGECVQFQPNRPTTIVVIPRRVPPSHPSAPSPAAPMDVITLETQAGFVFHHANAFEQDGKVIVDSICYESLPELQPGTDYQDIDFSTLPSGQLWRFTLDLATRTAEHQRLEPRCCEFPALHPQVVGRPYRYTYVGAAHAPTGNAPLQAILKIDTQSGDRQLWSEAPYGFVGEPVFVPRPGSSPSEAEDDGWLLSVVFNAERNCSDVIILDAQDLTRGPIARLHLIHHIPYGLHGMFTPDSLQPDSLG